MAKQETNTPTFGMHFRTLTAIVDASAERAKSEATAAMTARIARLKLAAEHIRSGGKLRQVEIDQISLPEQAYLKAVQLGQDPDIKETVKEINGLFAKSIDAIKKFGSNIFRL